MKLTQNPVAQKQIPHNISKVTRTNKSISYILFTAVLALVAGFAFADNRNITIAPQSIIVTPESIVVNPVPAFNVDVWVDKDPSGYGTPQYVIGEAVKINVRVSETSYVYLFNVRSTGEINQILPNRYDPYGHANYLQAGEIKRFPAQGANYRFLVDGPIGLDKLIAVASKHPLNTHELADFENGSAFAESNIGISSFAQTLSIIVEPLPQSEWVTDILNFQVLPRYAFSPVLPLPIAAPVVEVKPAIRPVYYTLKNKQTTDYRLDLLPFLNLQFSWKN